jgi:hypothetical protein
LVGTGFQVTDGIATIALFDAEGNALPATDAFGQLAAPRNLDIKLPGTSLVLSWFLSGTGLSLVTSTDLIPPAMWSSVTNAVQSTGTAYQATPPMDSGPQRSYRLQSNW